ncbi:carboxylating nicotinate-nucleotide diphosphorylase [Marinobacterium lutimaris]|uniref:Probable nicotinate-nucleotide pyrophosphorylase [carboxylating] n=1 Tax=Marinobacterium lutimaris TaxID=568106 RepID=A0A1H6DUF1_9GAMM|nr:carboxylating nicotinate-nucleotide diphosphorylase [Marinobacterium lutimaris]SEG88908.1 nicotinate-nucleotide pyrophosphorylase [carboxylating] [Marinobacterium lutimaris]
MYDKFQADRLIDFWLSEDIGHCDLTSQLMIDSNSFGVFYLNCRENLIVSGVEIVERVFKRYDPSLEITSHVIDGQRLEAGSVLMTVRGRARSILTAERTALNIIQRLSGIANETYKYVAAIEGTETRVIDTRKTTPGLRMLDKHAVACGGGLNHRLGLDSGVMIKDNHIVTCGSIKKAVHRVRENVPVLTKIEVECDKIEQVSEALEAAADVIMLDNMSIDQMVEAVNMVNGLAKLEASGNITLKTVRAIAETGVDFVSTSKITQSFSCVDIGLDES